jgi:glutathione S-transferase
MSQPILHHYEISPFAEKIRLALGRKGLAWQSVQAPMVMPKPDYVELTGGYRRVPMLQLGADVYCDTRAIARVLDRLLPSPPLVPAAQEAEIVALSRWAESNFMLLIVAFFGIGGVFPPEFVEDRKRTMVPPGMDVDRAHVLLPTKLLQLRANLERLDGMLADGRRFLLGAEPTLADLSAFHPLLLLGLHERSAALLAPVPRVVAWMEHVRAIGHGTRSEITAAEAIAVAREATPARFEGEPVLPDGMKLGDPVVVLADEYGSGVVAGALAASDLHEIAVRRTSARAGDLVVHFPRDEYTVVAAG